MARNVETPNDVDIRTMRKQFTNVGNLLAAGPGTPWDDRGAVGAVGAYFKTVTGMLTGPRKILYSLRRPETAGDARAFALICCAFWGIGWVLCDLLSFRRAPAEFDFTVQGYQVIIHFALGFAGAWLMLKLVARVFYKLASAGEMRSRFPTVLASNVYSYCMAPSIFALIPFYYAGPAVAAAWAFGLMVFAATTRLAIKTSGAIVCNAIAFVGVVGAGAGLYFTLKAIGHGLSLIPD